MDIQVFPTLSVDSKIENFSAVKEWLQSILDQIDCEGKPAKQLFIAVDEIFTNIVNYAYENIGKIELLATFNQTDNTLKITIKDNGFAYNPLEKPDPDIAKRIKDKTIGGLGVFMVKKLTDSIEYYRQENENILILNKKIN
jgi:anti-sigma regulatory factor (Ser/Thr protein kinase)